MFKDNPEFIPAYTHEQTGIVFYMPSELTNYHKAREMAMSVQDTYSRCGISREVLQSFADKLLEMANKQLVVDTLKTDIGVIANNLKFRMSSIVDEQCAVRMGALACFLDGEDPNKVVEAWTSKKVKLANEHPDIYAFFLHTGIAFTPEYSNLLRGLQAEEYLVTRNLSLDGLTLQSTHKT